MCLRNVPSLNKNKWLLSSNEFFQKKNGQMSGGAEKLSRNQLQSRSHCFCLFGSRRGFLLAPFNRRKSSEKWRIARAFPRRQTLRGRPTGLAARVERKISSAAYTTSYERFSMYGGAYMPNLQYPGSLMKLRRTIPWRFETCFQDLSFQRKCAAQFPTTTILEREMNVDPGRSYWLKYMTRSG